MRNGLATLRRSEAVRILAGERGFRAESRTTTRERGDLLSGSRRPHSAPLLCRHNLEIFEGGGGEVSPAV
jgi:hypothetical protein